MLIVSKFKKFLILLCLMAISAHAQQDSKAQPLELVVILSLGCEEVLKISDITHEPCCNELFNACKEDQIVLVSPSILYGLLKRKRDGKDCISNCLDRVTRHYAIYLNQDKDFVLLIPASKQNSLKDLGFEETQITRIDPAALMQFSEDRWSNRLIEINHFQKLFKQAETGYEPPAKHIYLISHGIDALDEVKDFKWSIPLIASLTAWQFVNFLQMLNTINTKFLHIASCYAAGTNFFNIQRILAGDIEDERCTNARIPIEFPIMVQGTTDSAVSAIIGDGLGCKSFFSVIRQWLETNKNGDMLSELLSKYFYDSKNQGLAPNHPMLKLSASCPVTSLPVQGAVIINQDGLVIDATPDLHYLFFYPTVLHKTTLTIETLTAVPHCISKIFGRSNHFLGTIQVPQLDQNNIVSLLERCFLKEAVRNHDGRCSYGVSDKAWFIDTLVDTQNNSAAAKGIVVQKGMLKYATHKALIVYQDDKGNFHRLKLPLPIQHDSVHNEIISEDEYIQAVARIFWETSAHEDTLSCATCGEDYFLVKEGLREFFRTTDLSMPNIDARRFIQEDLTQLRSEKFKKEAYLNYVAYVHDPEILNELIELSINHSDLIDFDDIATILTHLIDMEQQAISLQIVCELLGKDDVAAKRAAINTLTYMVNVGLYLHASRTCEAVLACVEAVAHKQMLPGCEVALVEEIRDFLAKLIQIMVKEDQIQAANLVMGTMINHEQWYMYGLGLEVYNQLMKQKICNLSIFTQTRLEWFADQLTKNRTSAALAVYFEQMQVIDKYRQLANA